jgi:splicing factor 3B subunit 5
MSSREILNSQLEHLQMKYVGTGHADTTRHEWLTNQHRDSYASYIGHYSTMAYFAVAENESIGRVRYDMLEKMILPCGPKPTEKDLAIAVSNTTS